MLKHCAANRKRRLSALPNVGPYIYDVKISGFTGSSIYIYDISRLRVKKWGLAVTPSSSYSNSHSVNQPAKQPTNQQVSQTLIQSTAQTWRSLSDQLSCPPANPRPDIILHACPFYIASSKSWKNTITVLWLSVSLNALRYRTHTAVESSNAYFSHHNHSSYRCTSIFLFSQ
jgi:hypothetical protein